MFNLTYQVDQRFRFLKTLYGSKEEPSAFYEAFDERNKRKVGVKSLSVAPRDLPFAEQEAHVIHLFSRFSTNIPALYDTHYDKKDERFYIIMQLIEGGVTLKDMLESRVNLTQGLQLMIDLCEVLEPIHRANYQHRDLKPANIMIQNRNVYVIDFNLTTQIPFKGEGTEDYRAPEQDKYVAGVGQDRADIFSLGVILYELCTGHRPVSGIDYVPERKKKIWRKFTPPTEYAPQLHIAICQIIERCMDIDSAKRYANANELKRALLQAKRQIR
nr:serine/threonine-protein kinase [Fredinandcohnia onubensis]